MIKRIAILLLSSILIVVSWLIFSPENGFGLSFYGLTTFNKIPYFYSDIEVDLNGKTKRVQKTHKVTREVLEDLINQEPDIIIISKGWSGKSMEIIDLHSSDSLRIIKKKNKEAIKTYNKLKNEGKRVVIYYHSTC